MRTAFDFDAHALARAQALLDQAIANGIGLLLQLTITD